VFVLTVSRRASKALTENQLHVRYSGVCVDSRPAIADSFVSTVTVLLRDEHGPCPPDHRCSVEHVEVVCGRQTSRRRRLSRRWAVTEATVRLTLSAELADGKATASKQSRLLHTLDNVVDAMRSAALEHRLLPVDGDVTDVREVTRTWQPVVCRDGEVRNEGDLSACCKSSLTLDTVKDTQLRVMKVFHTYCIIIIM